MAKNILEEIVNKYNKEISNRTKNIELEIKFKNVDYRTFSIIYEHMKEHTNPKDVIIYQAIKSLMQQKGNYLKSVNIREKQYKNGNAISNSYMSKTPLLVPYRYIASSGISYKVTLSLEKSDIKPFISDETSIIRIINRVSFLFIDDSIKWRIDMSVVRQLGGSNLRTIESVVNQMFKQHTVTVDNMLSLFNESKTSQKFYDYEIEAELVNNEKIKTVHLTNMAHNILKISNPNYMSENTLQNKIYELAKYLIHSPAILNQYQSKYGLKQLLPKVQTLTRYDYKNIYPMTNFYITDKADGIRAIVMTDAKYGYILSDVLNVFELTSESEVYILDAEWVNNVAYAFDIIVYNNQKLTDLSFSERILYLPMAIESLKKVGLSVESKYYVQIVGNLENTIKHVYYRERPYDIDGLIFVNPVDNYMNTKTYKWKEIRDNTIDFLVKKAPHSILGKKPFIIKEPESYVLYFLFVGISIDLYKSLGLRLCPGYNDIFDDNKLIESSTYFPIQFSPSNAPLAYLYYHPNDNILDIENNVVEFRCVDNCDGIQGSLISWKPVRIRTDRKKDIESKTYYGNDYRIAEITWINYLDPFPIEQLWLNISNEYFLSNKAGIYHAQTSVLSFLKTERIMSYAHKRWIIDIGSGKGQDLGRYFNAQIANLIAIDNDRASLSELVRRKFVFAQDNTGKKISTSVYIILADMTSSYDLLLNKVYNIANVDIENQFADVIICNLSIHYFIYNDTLLHNFIKFVNRLLKPDGKLVITCFFGESVFKQLATLQENQDWTIYENDIVKYSIKKLYSSEILENNGQKIGVLLPFSRGEYYEEYLVNTEYLTSVLATYKFTRTSKKQADSILKEFKLKNPAVYNMLTPDDITYLSLYGELIFERNKKKSSKQ